MNTSELIQRVREATLEFSQTPFSDSLILNRLNHYGDLAYTYITATCEDFSEEVEVEVPSRPGAHEATEIRINNLHNYKINKVYYWLTSARCWQELPALNFHDFYDKLQTDCKHSLPEYFTTKKDLILLTPTSHSYQIKILYTPKFKPFSINDGRIIDVNAEELTLDTVPETLVANSSGYWNVFSITGINGNHKGTWNYTADGSNRVSIVPTVLVDYEGEPLVHYDNVELTAEVDRDNPEGTVRTFRLSKVPRDWEVGMHVEVDKFEGGTYVSDYLHSLYAAELADALDGSYLFVQPDMENVDTIPATTYRIVAIDGDDIDVEPVDETLQYPTIFKNGYLNEVPRYGGYRRFILEGSTLVSITGADAVTTLSNTYTLELSAIGFQTAKFQATRVSETDWYVSAILPTGYSELSNYPNNYFAHSLEAPRYTDVAILDPDNPSTPLFEGSIVIEDSPEAGGILVCVDEDGVIVPHEFTSQEHEDLGFPSTKIRVTLKDSHGTGSSLQPDLQYTQAIVSDAHRLQLSFPVGAFYMEAKAQSTGEGTDASYALFNRRQWAAEFPQVSFTRVHVGTPSAQFHDLYDRDEDLTVEPVKKGDIISYGIGVPTDALLGDVSTFLVEATALALQNSLKEGTELLYESLRSHWTAVRSYGSMGKRTETKVKRSRIQLKTRRHAR